MSGRESVQYIVKTDWPNQRVVRYRFSFLTEMWQEMWQLIAPVKAG